jgi:hypothetical protein
MANINIFSNSCLNSIIVVSDTPLEIPLGAVVDFVVAVLFAFPVGVNVGVGLEVAM